MALTRALAGEGAPHGIGVNALAPAAITRLTAGADAGPLQEWWDKWFQPARVSPVVAWLAHEECPVSGEIYSAGGGRVARVFIAETPGHWSENLTPEEVRDRFAEIRDERDYAQPASSMEEMLLYRSRIPRRRGDMSEKHEFGSRGWFDALHRTIDRIAREAGPEIEAVRWSICEVFVDVPAHLAQGPGNQAAWHCRIRGRDVDFGLGEIDDADLKIIADYATALPLSHAVLADPEVQARVNETLANAVMAGKMQIRGSLEARPAAFAGLHDEMVKVTA